MRGFGIFFTEINFTTNFAIFFATNTAVFNVVFNYVAYTPSPTDAYNPNAREGLGRGGEVGPGVRGG